MEAAAAGRCLRPKSGKEAAEPSASLGYGRLVDSCQNPAVAVVVVAGDIAVVAVEGHLDPLERDDDEGEGGDSQQGQPHRPGPIRSR